MLYYFLPVKSDILSVTIHEFFLLAVSYRNFFQEEGKPGPIEGYTITEVPVEQWIARPGQ